MFYNLDTGRIDMMGLVKFSSLILKTLICQLCKPGRCKLSILTCSFLVQSIVGQNHTSMLQDCPILN